MSLDIIPLKILYRKIPLSKRICSYYRCAKPVRRNLDRYYLLKTGHIYHHGCLMAAQDERYRCLECYSIFDATEAVLYEKQRFQGDEVKQILGVSCPNCGCQNLKQLLPFGGS